MLQMFLLLLYCFFAMCEYFCLHLSLKFKRNRVNNVRWRSMKLAAVFGCQFLYCQFLSCRFIYRLARKRELESIDSLLVCLNSKNLASRNKFRHYCAELHLHTNSNNYAIFHIRFYASVIKVAIQQWIWTELVRLR